MNNPIVTFTFEDKKEIKAELYPEIAKNTVNNFIELIEKGFYDNLIFHRVIPGFMIQGGCPLKNGTGNPGYSIKGEFLSNGVVNSLKHETGVLSMARARDKNSAGSQFFIMVASSPHLDGDYAAFGKVISGIDIAIDISKTETDYADRPVNDVALSKVSVDLNGYEPEDVIRM